MADPIGRRRRAQHGRDARRGLALACSGVDKIALVTISPAGK